MAFDFAHDTTLGDSNLESPWDDGPENATAHAARDVEWTKISSDFTNAGYREGITAGKESSLQEGFNAGFAQVGAPLGREIGMLRGVASALLAIFDSPSPVANQHALAETQEISSLLAKIRFSDIAPPDLEAEAHARKHLETYGEGDDEMDVVDGEVKDKRDIEQLEDMLNEISTNQGNQQRSTQPGVDEIQQLSQRLAALCQLIHVDFALP